MKAGGQKKDLTLVSKVQPGDLVCLTGRTINPNAKKIQLVVKVELSYFDKYFSMHEKGNRVYTYHFSDGTTGISYAYKKIDPETFQIEKE